MIQSDRLIHSVNSHQENANLTILLNQNILFCSGRIQVSVQLLMLYKRILHPEKMQSDKVSPPVHRADSRIQDMSATENKYNHI